VQTVVRAGTTLSAVGSKEQPDSGMLTGDTGAATRNAFVLLFALDSDSSVAPVLGWDSGDLG
jgi:hypothetical protein